MKFKVLFLFILLSAPVFAQDKQLSVEQSQRLEIQQLKEQLFQATVQIVQLQSQLANLNLTAQSNDLHEKHVALEKELISVLGGTIGDTLDWSSTPPKLVKAEKK